MGSDSIDRSRAGQPTYASVAPKAQRQILVHAVVAGLTPLIPLPFVDDWARDGVQTRMVRRIAKEHDKLLYESDQKTLGKESGHGQSLVYGVAKKLAFYPIRRLFRTALFVLVVKDIVDVASRTYHVGYLLDYLIGRDLPNQVRAETLRAAVDTACHEADTSPVRRAFASVFEESRELLGDAVQTMRGWVGGDTGSRATEPQQVEALADRLQRAVNVLPPQHFVDLRGRFDEALGRMRT